MMNYFHQLKGFRLRKKLCQLAAPEIALWFALMSISNELGQTDRLSLSVSTLMEEAGINSRTSFNRARNRLKSAGFIDWESRKGNQAALYSLTDLAAVYQYGTQSGTQDGTQCGTQDGTQCGSLYKLNGIEKNHFEEDDERQLRARMQETVTAVYLAAFGKPITPMMCSAMTASAMLSGAGTEIMRRAIEKAAADGAGNAVAYVSSLLADWAGEHIHTDAELDEYLFLRDCASGKHPREMQPEAAQKAIADSRKKRFALYQSTAQAL